MTARSVLASMLRSGGWIAAAAVVSILPSQALAQGQVAPSAQADGAAAGDAGGGLGGYFADAPLPTFGGYVDLAGAYTTNARGYGSGPSNGDDVFTRGRIGLFVNYKRPRIDLHGDYQLSGLYYGRYHSANHLTNRLSLTSQTTVIPEYLFVTANAFASPADLTRVGAIGASGEPISNYNTRDSYGYFAQPVLRFRFDDFATAALSASQGGVFFVNPSTANSGPIPPINTPRNYLYSSVSGQLASGSNFARLHWVLMGSYSEYSQTVRSQKNLEGTGRLTYAVTPFIRVFGIGGYSEYKSSIALGRNLSGPTGMGGVTYTNGGTFTMTVEAGTRQNLPTYLGSLQWSISPRTAVMASVTDAIGTPQGDILSRVAQMSAMPGGGFSDNGSGLGVGSLTGYSPVSAGGLALDNSIYRLRSAQGSIVHTGDRMRCTLTVYGEERDQLNVTPGVPTLPRTSLFGLRAAVSRTLNERMSAYVGGGYSYGNEFGGHDEIVTANGQLTYRLSRSISVYLSNYFVHRNSRYLSGVVNVPLTEDQTIIGIRASF